MSVISGSSKSCFKSLAVTSVFLLAVFSATTSASVANSEEMTAGLGFEEDPEYQRLAFFEKVRYGIDRKW